MSTFDPKAAADSYVEPDDVELVNIAYLDPGYLPAAKELAVRELNRRGALRNKAGLIDRARKDLAEGVRASRDDLLASREVDQT